MKNLVKAYLREKKGSKCYSCILKWEEDGNLKSKEISTGIEIKGNNKRIAKKRIEEIREALKIILFHFSQNDIFCLLILHLNIFRNTIIERLNRDFLPEVFKGIIL